MVDVALGANTLRDLHRHLAEQLTGYRFFEVTTTILLLLLGITLIIAGVGLIRESRWGAMLTMVCAGVMILLQILVLIYELSVIHPYLKRYLLNEGWGFMEDPEGYISGRKMRTIISIITFISHASVNLGYLLTAGRSRFGGPRPLDLGEEEQYSPTEAPRERAREPEPPRRDRYRRRDEEW